MKTAHLLPSLVLALSIVSHPLCAASAADSAADSAAVLADTQSYDDTTETADADSAQSSLVSSPKPDSLAADSLKKAARRDSLTSEKSRAMAAYRSFPVSLDSLYNPFSTGRQAIFSSDLVNISEIARTCPQMAAAPFSLSNNLNRSMPYGFPLPGAVMTTDGELFSGSADVFTGSDRISSTQLSGLSTDPLQRLRLTPHLDDCVTPETDMLWETGLFFENILNIRFVRPLSPDLTFGIFSNNRYFKSLNYTTKNDIKSLYGYFVTDTTMLVQSGKNPLVEDQNTELRFASRGKNGERRYFSAGYHDEKNEIAYELPDSLRLYWDRIFQFGSIVDAGFEGLPLSRLSMDAQLHVESGGHSRYNPLKYSYLSGRTSEYSLAIKPYIPLKNDTILATAGVTRYLETVYDQSKRTTMREDVSLGGTHHNRLFGADAFVSGMLGQCFISRKRSSLEKNDWTAALSAGIESRRQKVRAFASRAVAPYPPVYDTASASVDPFFKMYESYGAEYFGCYDKIGLMAGICGVSGLGSGDSLFMWPNNMLPYRQPRVSYVLAPMFGQWHGLSAVSRWMMSDSRPYFKVQTSLSYRVHPLGGREHILLDLVHDYWSNRDPITYGGDSTWNREIHSLSLKIAVQIKTFSLFFKTDNILNRSYAYVPGYWMPGLTFRWGFQWLIQG